MSIDITQEMIDQARNTDACSEALDWLNAEPRTFNELRAQHPGWYAWALTHHVEGVPFDLTGLDPYDRARVMAYRPDCPLDLTGLDSFDRARVMAHRPDCQIDLTGLTPYQRVLVMTNRPDCPIDLTGLDLVERARVTSVRGDHA
jgi:hypothetical protein